MSDNKIEPTIIGKNENLKFLVPQDLFELNLSSEDHISPTLAKDFSEK